MFQAEVLKQVKGEILIRSNSQGYSIYDFSEIPIITDKDGAIVFLGDISNIKDTFQINLNWISYLMVKMQI